MFGSAFVALVGIFNLMASCIVPGQSNMTLQHGMSDTDWTTDQTSGDDSDDSKENETLLPTAEVKEE